MFDPISLGISAMALGGGALYSRFNKKKKNDDPLAGIRAQLQALAGRIPGLVAQQKEQIGKRYSDLRTEGIRDIGEDVYATRGMGRTSIYDRLKTELIDKLAKSQGESELAAEQWGVGQEASILSGAGSLAAQEQPEEPSMISKILGGGAQLGAQYLGNKWEYDSLEKLFGSKKAILTPEQEASLETPDFLDIAKRKSSYLTT